MLETLNLDLEMDKQTFKERRRQLEYRLFNLSHATWKAKIPVLILFEGWDTAGKDRCIKALTERQDPRGFRVEYITDPRTHEKQHPWMRRFWLRLPKYGELAIFYSSWYRRVLVERVLDGLSDIEVKDALRDITKTEMALTDDGMVIIKILLHISRKQYKRRLEKRQQHPIPGYPVTERQWDLYKHYPVLLDAFEEMLERTESGHAPWHFIPAEDGRYAQITVMETVADMLEKTLAHRHIAWKPVRQQPETKG